MSVEEDVFRAEINELRERVESLEKWAGTNSQQSLEKQAKITNEKDNSDQLPAQTTENLSLKTETEFSVADLMDGLSDE